MVSFPSESTFRDRPSGPLSELSKGSCWENGPDDSVSSFYLMGLSTSSVFAYSRCSSSICQVNRCMRVKYLRGELLDLIPFLVTDDFMALSGKECVFLGKMKALGHTEF